MSFEVVCPGCGAASGPSVGICPFCKALMSSPNDKNFAQESSVQKFYQEGKLSLALALAKKMYAGDANSKADVGFLLMYAKILIDTEGPTSHIKGVLSEAYLLDPENKEVLDYLELIEARSLLKKGLNDSGEMQIKNVIRRSPQNLHANFILGSHLFWADQQTEMAIPYLEMTVRIHPNFVRAWGCLGAIYRKMGNNQLAQRAFQKCIELENNASMKQFFEEQLKAIK